MCAITPLCILLEVVFTTDPSAVLLTLAVIIHTTNVMCLLPMLLVSAINFFLFLVTLRLVLRNSSRPWARRACLGLEPFTDPIPQAIRTWLSSYFSKRPPEWLAWALVIAVALIVQQCLVALILVMS